jgi:hypothetical protein
MPRRDLDDIGSPALIQHVTRATQEVRKGLAIPAIADGAMGGVQFVHQPF